MPRRSAPKASRSISDDSTESSNSAEHLAAKKRKPTYLVRKEEEKTLRDEILQLEAQVAVLKAQGIPAGSALVADPGLQDANAKSKVLTDAVKQQQLGLAEAKSLMTECMRTQYSNPLCTRICLKKDWGERRATLLAIRKMKLRNTYEYVVTRSSHTPEAQGKHSRELFETDNGDVCSLGSTVVHFPGVRSLKQVFEALWFYLTNMEISISERLGHITVREDYDMIEGSAYNARIMSSDGNASDCVDEDELYPYLPSEHVRKDISGGVVMTASRQKELMVEKYGELQDGENAADDDELVVTMRRAGYLKLHRPEFPVTPHAQQELEAGIGDWGKVMIKAMREILYARA